MTVQTTTLLGGTASDIKVGKIALGLMYMTWTPNPVPDEQCFAAIKAGVDLLPPDTGMVLNSAEFYAQDLSTANLDLLARFFNKYPDYADKVFLSVKGVADLRTFAPDSSPENLVKSISKINAALRGTKRVDLFECARVDHRYPIEDTIRRLKEFVDQGFAETLRKAYAVHPIVGVEIEVSPWSMEDETKSVLAAAQELGVAVFAYSPLGRGFLTGQLKSPADLPEGDHRRTFARFSEEYFKHNLAFVDALKELADKKNVSVAALTLAWVANLGPKVIPLPGSSEAQGVVENSHAADLKLTDTDNAEIWDLINNFEIKGKRYFDVDPKTLHLWG